ncbi:S-(hydroxymethyl)mycothiol dehydrogenase [Pseudonocardia sp. TMWB2A]|uniref:S-(hydroxymethyl)mycothiol dehydrogenase n=1 Tax=Pseudonocardia sp. TMWB2A TaxID=687430 RepID=UPI00307E1905
MSQEVRGVVALDLGKPVTVETVVVPDPGPDEAVVRVQACGVCQTDVHFRDGGIPGRFPILLGHEAAGVVESVGEGVTDVAPGDFVILNWRAVCGACRSCRDAEPWSCTAPRTASTPMTLTDGTPLGTAMGIGAFAEKTLVHAGQCTKVDPRISPQVAGLIGCGVTTGFGAAVTTGGVRPGHTVAVIGCGGVGDAAIAGARTAGATTVIGIDTDPRKLEWATGFGAGHTVDARDTDVVERVRELTGGAGADVVIDAVGLPQTWKQAFYARRPSGTLVLVGVPHPDATVPDLPLIDFFRRDGAIRSSRYGECLPSRDFPRLVELHLGGRLPLQDMVTEEIGIDDVETAFARMRDGEVIRSVVVF